MKKLLLLLSIICVSNIAYTQSDFRKGYIITLKNDTLSGFIDYRDGVKNFETCSFKKNENDEPIDYRPSKLKGYRINEDKFFEPRLIENENEYQELVFLEVLIRGKVSLFKHKSTFFIDKGDTSFHKLIVEKIELLIDGEKNIRESKKHLGILSYLLSDCSDMRKEIQGTRLSEEPLMKLIKKYHQCQDIDYNIFRAEKPGVRLLISPFTGINLSNTIFLSKRENLNYLTAGNFQYNSPTFGLNLNLFFPRYSNKISIQTGIAYLSLDYFSSHKTFNGSFTTEINDVSIQIKQIKVPIGLQYSLTKKRFTPYFNIGLSAIFNIQNSSHWIQDSERSNIVTTIEDEAIALKGTQFGWWGGFGISMKISNENDLFLEFKYEKTETDGFTDSIKKNKVSNVDQYFSTTTNIQLLVGITF